MKRIETEEEHKERHIQLHRAFDELFADWVNHNDSIIKFTECPIIELMEWSHEQTKKPDHPIRKKMIDNG